MTNPSHLCDVLLFMCIYEFRDTIKTNNNNIKKRKKHFIFDRINTIYQFIKPFLDN